MSELNIIWTELIPAKEDMEELTLYISREYHTASHLCACGCKNLVVTPLGTANGWSLTENNGQVSLKESVGNEGLPCKSHYMITDNQIIHI